MIILDGEAFNSNQHPEDSGEGYSEDVLIDIDGMRKHFCIGWYDFDDKEWVTDSPAVTIDQEKMKWLRLPFDRD
jgi:hypothetical protein